ncbi:luc7-like protein 3 [Anthonomus grandis grandis]|uniref:luc7-like protein 3 n=1 Tax=Anthonomus grandis grandis TaxID=2921223 RepID=UPI0021656B73|nr:luc7-like protein 3 [Anthonomus grandis grandis]XP_050315235.1 luc7-like protein 3 [Anthonomus grandis grandis]
MDDKNMMNIDTVMEDMQNFLNGSANTVKSTEIAKEVRLVEIGPNNPAYWAEIFRKQANNLPEPPQYNREIRDNEQNKSNRKAEAEKEDEEKERQIWIRQRREEGRMREQRIREERMREKRIREQRIRREMEVTPRVEEDTGRNRGRMNRSRSKSRDTYSRRRHERQEERRERDRTRSRDSYESRRGDRGEEVHNRGRIRGRGRGRDERMGNGGRYVHPHRGRGRGRREIANTQTSRRQPQQVGSGVVGCLQFNNIASMVEFTKQFFNK